MQKKNRKMTDGKKRKSTPDTPAVKGNTPLEKARAVYNKMLASGKDELTEGQLKAVEAELNIILKTEGSVSETNSPQR
ncbi:MAG: hypothetical protein ABIJ16_04820, partial [Bacteroidota bacterium]